MQLFAILPIISLLFLFSVITSQSAQQITALQSNYNKRNLGLSQRLITNPNQVVVASPWTIENHQDILPVQAMRFTQVPAVVESEVSETPQINVEKLTTAIQSNPVLAAVLINTLLGLNSGPQPATYNTPAHQPPNPYIALLLSHYGRYIARPGYFTHGIYGYTAANNIHNTRPFGSYKIYDDSA